jgi:hypothetical protein
MNNSKAQMFRIILMCVVVLLVTIFGISLSNKPDLFNTSGYSGPGGKNGLSPTTNKPDIFNTSGYPGPEVKDGVSPTTDPETFCAQYFDLDNDLPPDKKQAEEERYKKCVEARQSPIPTYNNAHQMPEFTMEPTQLLPIPRRKAGIGTIIETGLAPFPSYLTISNQWYTESGNKLMRVFAGAQRSDGAKELPKPWAGLVIIEVSSTKDLKTFFPNEGGSYYTPKKSGIVRIIDADGDKLVLLAENGDIFYFDLASRNFLTTETKSPYSRKAGSGYIVEERATNFPIGEFKITNQWYFEEDNQRVTVLAGEDSQAAGAIAIVTSSLDLQKVLSIEFVHIPIGPLRIFDANNKQITLVSGENIFVFDTQALKFTQWPEFPPDVSQLGMTATATSNTVIQNAPSATHIPNPPTTSPYP